MPRTDTYEWTISSGATFQHGTYLCGEPWVVDNGDLTITAVTPTEAQVNDTVKGISGPTNITLLNPDNGRLYWTDTGKKNINHDLSYVSSEWQWSTDGMTTGAVSGDQITTGSTILNDFRGGMRTGSESSSIGTEFYADRGATFPLSIEAGDQVLINTGYTGDIDQGGDEPFTESLGVLTVVSSAPGASAFRPPVNWDPALKSTRPEFLELDDLRAGPGGTAHEWILPDYNFTSDTKTWSATSPSKFTIADAQDRLGPVLYMPATSLLNSRRGTLTNQAASDSEYGNYPATIEESMLTYVFDSTVSGATQDLLRRTLVQRGIDLWGFLEGRGGRYEHNGGHMTRYNPLIFLAWCVTGNTGMYNYLNDGSIGTGANSSYIPQQKDPHGPIYGTYTSRQQEFGHVSWNNEACSFRHYDMRVLEQGTADNLHYVKVARPISRWTDRGVTGNTYGTAPIWISTSSTNNAGANWGRCNNQKYVDALSLWDSAYVRIKGQSGGQPYEKITRVVDAQWLNASDSVVTSADDRRNPTSGILYLMDDVIPTDGGITGVDISNCLVNTRPSHMSRHVTYTLENTASEAGGQAYQYAAMFNALNNWKLVEIKGGTANVPNWGKHMHERAVYYASDVRGKASFQSQYSSTYNNGAVNPEDSLYYALMRQGPGAGVSLPHMPYEYKQGYQTKPGSGTTAEYWRTAFAIPYDATWEEINFDKSKIKFWTLPKYDTNSGNPYYRYTDYNGGLAGSTYTSEILWTSVTPDDATNQGSLRLRSNGGATHGLFNIDALGLVPYLLPMGTRNPIKLQLDSSSAADDTSTSWNDYYSIKDHPGKAENLLWNGSAVFWAEDTALTPGSGFAAAFDSDYDNSARFGQSVFRAEYTQSATMDGNPRNENTEDNFARVSYPNLHLGQPNIYSATADFDLDIYTFHGAGIKEVEVVADGGTPVLATLVEGADAVSPLGHGGHYRVPIEIKNGAKGFTPGTTSEIRITSKPYNGYDRTVQFRLSAVSGENKVVIDPSSTIASAYDTVMGAFDETKRNLVELSVSGGYTMGTASAAAAKDYGYVEVSPADGVSAEIDLTRGGNNVGVRPQFSSIKWDRIAWKNNITEYSGWTGYAANTLVYVEDTARYAIWWLNNCSFTSNWHTGLYNGQPYWQLDGTTAGGVVPQGMDFFRNSYNQQFWYTDCMGTGMNNGFGGALLANGCTQDYCYQDSYTNVKSCINSASTNKITPGFSGRHADHWQLFNGVTGAYENTQGETFDSVALVSNFLLYGYYGQDVNQYVQQFGFFGTSNEYYSDIAHVNCFWTGATGSGSAQIGVKYDHVLNIGLTSENGSITVRSDGTQYGPVLMKNINVTYIGNGYQTPLNNPPGATNEFRERGTIVPDIIYTGTPSSDALLEPYYQWHVSTVGLSAAGVGNLYAAPGQKTDGANMNLPVTATGMTTGYPDTHTAIAFGRGSSAGWTDSTRLAYNNFSNNGTTWSTITMTNFADNAEAVAFEESGGRAGWWLKIETDQGYAYPSSGFSARSSGGIGDWGGYQGGVMGGVGLHQDGITSSATGITFTLMKLPDDSGTSNLITNNLTYNITHDDISDSY